MSFFKLDIGEEFKDENQDNENILLPKKIDCVHVQKIGTIQVKKNNLSIYNIETQMVSTTGDENDISKYMIILTTMGNLNPSGLSV